MKIKKDIIAEILFFIGVIILLSSLLIILWPIQDFQRALGYEYLGIITKSIIAIILIPIDIIAVLILGLSRIIELLNKIEQKM